MAFEVFSFFVGFIVGIILAILIVWLMYAMRWGFFAHCAASTPVCKNSQYINNPGVAETNGYPASETLTVINGKLNYKRPTTDNCTPGANQVVVIPFPQYCQFESSGTLYQARISGPVGDKQANYVATSSSRTFTSAANCTPITGATSGVPLPLWDPANPST